MTEDAERLMKVLLAMRRDRRRYSMSVYVVLVCLLDGKLTSGQLRRRAQSFRAVRAAREAASVGLVRQCGFERNAHERGGDEGCYELTEEGRAFINELVEATR